MPKVKHVKARKDYPDHGIAKGEMCYVWSMKTGPRSSVTRRSKERPKQSQLTSSEFFQTFYSIQEDADDNPPASWDEIESIRDSLRERVEELRSSTEEKYNNMPEGLQQGSTGELLQGRVDALQELIDELENIDTSWEDDEHNTDDDVRREDETETEFEERIKEEAAERASEALNDRWSEVTDAFSNVSCE